MIKTNFLSQNTVIPPAITVDEDQLDIVHHFMNLGSTTTDNLYLNAELDKRIGMAASTLSHLTTRVWTNPRLTTAKKKTVYDACVISRERDMDHICQTRAETERFPSTSSVGITWQDNVSNDSRPVSPAWTHAPTMSPVLAWQCTPDGELASGKGTTGRSNLRFKDFVKRVMKAIDINTQSGEDLKADHPNWGAP